MNKIKDYLHELLDVKVEHCYRVVNKLADALARLPVYEEFIELDLAHVPNLFHENICNDA